MVGSNSVLEFEAGPQLGDTNFGNQSDVVVISVISYIDPEGRTCAYFILQRNISKPCRRSLAYSCLAGGM